MYKSIHFVFHCAPGDMVAFTSVLRDIAYDYPDMRVCLDTNHPQVFRGRDFVVLCPANNPQGLVIPVDYLPGVEECMHGRPIHFTGWFHRWCREQLGMTKLKWYDARPAISTAPKARPRPIQEPYWLMLAGGKTDITIKHWRHERYQAVVDELAKHGIRVAQTGAVKPEHVHRPLERVHDLLGVGDLTDFFSQIAHADGVICPVTCAMHVAAAYDKPCVVLGGGREDPAWAAYDPALGGFKSCLKTPSVPHRYLHSVGQLECCQKTGCWNQQLDVPGATAERLCPHPKPNAQAVWPVAQCMAEITVDQVVSAVLSYYEDGTIPNYHRGTHA